MSIHRFKQDPESGRYISLAAACNGCAGCGSRAKSISLPLTRSEVDVDFGVANQRKLIVNSLVKPLLMLLVFVVLADLVGLSEFATIVAALLGFVVGMLICHPMNWNSFKLIGEDSC